MYTELLSLSQDLARLVDDGYFAQIKGNYLLVRDVPYVDSQKRVKRGTLISTLNLAGNVTQKPDTHVVFFDGEYSNMHKGIEAIEENLTATNLHLLDGSTFVFLSMDSGKLKLAIVEKLESLGVPFIDVGMGMSVDDFNLTGQLRVTTSIPECREVFRSKVPMDINADDDLYATNIQVADLNAFNAILAVIKWKKLRSFYYDFEQELHSSYTVDGNLLYNKDRA